MGQLGTSLTFYHSALTSGVLGSYSDHGDIACSGKTSDERYLDSHVLHVTHYL